MAMLVITRGYTVGTSNLHRTLFVMPVEKSILRGKDSSSRLCILVCYLAMLLGPMEDGALHNPSYGRMDGYPLVNMQKTWRNKTMERSTMLLMGKLIVSMVIFNSYVKLQEGSSFWLVSRRCLRDP